jgi:hypothetical protein
MRPCRQCVTLRLTFRQPARTQHPIVALWLVRSLAIGSEHTVIRCRLDFLTNRQLRKLRTLAELRLAAVSSLQHCAITLVCWRQFAVPYFPCQDAALPGC